MSLRCYRVASGTRIAPFGDLARDLHVGVTAVGAAQAAAVAACGLELVEVDGPEQIEARPALVLYDDVFVSEMALRQFVAEGLGATEDLVLAVPEGPIGRAIDPFDALAVEADGARRVDIAVLVDAAPLTDRDALRTRGRAWSLPTREQRRQVRLPPSFDAQGGAGQREAEVAVTARLAGPVQHWLHVLRLGQLSIGVSLLDALRGRPRLALRLRWRPPKDPWALARRLVFVHPTARVHPTADLEAAVIGPGAVVEAHAHVHRSVVGANVRVGDHAVVMGCALAEDVTVLPASYFAHCASMPGATLASYKAQVSLFGRGVFLTSSAWLIDAKLEGEVKVEHQGRLHSVGPFLGCCLGHGSTLGAQVLVQAGRSVPNGVTVVGSPDKFLSRIEESPPAKVCVVQDGRLKPL